MAKTNTNFETSLQELNILVDKMEHGDLDLEQALKYFEQGVTLIRKCQTELKQAEQKVQILVEKNSKLELEDYDTE